MSDIRLTEWRNSHVGTNYPLTDAATRLSTGGFRLPRNVFDDMSLFVVGGAVGAYLSRLDPAGGLLKIQISDPTNGLTCTALFDPDDPHDDLELLDALNRPAGVLAGSAERWNQLLASLPAGGADFKPAAATFVPSAVAPLPAGGVSGVLLDDGSLLTGDVFLVGVDGIVLSVEDGVVRVDAVGDPYDNVRDCVSSGKDVAIPCGIKTITGIPPDARGDWKLTVGGAEASDAAQRVAPIENGVRVEVAGRRR